VPSDIAKRLCRSLTQESALVMEPGRSIVGMRASLSQRRLYLKQGEDKPLLLSSGNDDLMRPSLYDAYINITPVVRGRGADQGHIVGPICESGEFLARGE